MGTRALYPIFLDLEGRFCVVIGGGSVAERKARGLLKAGAKVKVIAASATAGLVRLARAKKISLFKRRFSPSDLRGAFIVECATGDMRLNRRVAALARRRGILVNVADCPGLCDFYLPAVCRCGLLQIAVSTGGSSPAVAKHIRRELQERYGRGYAALLDAMAALRQRVIREVPAEKRASVFKAMSGPRMLRIFERGERTQARREMEKIIKRESKRS